MTLSSESGILAMLARCVTGAVVVLVVAAQPCAQSWRRFAGAVSPPPRSIAAMVFDPARGVTTLFGGLSDGPNGTIVLNDTWEWDGVAWNQRTLAVSPPPRNDHCMAYDPVRGHAVLFGGAVLLGGFFRDTWTYDGASWTLLSPTASPPARAAAGLAFDPVRQTILLFGGTANYFGAGLGDSWEWTGASWIQLAPANSPAPRMGHGMVGDPLRRRVLLDGGFTQGAPAAGSWLWDGSNWSLWDPLTTPAGPRTRFAYDSGRGLIARVEQWTGPPGVVLPMYVSEGYEQDLSWQGQPRPAARHWSTLSYDPVRDEVVLFGGGDDNVGYFGDTWLYRPTYKSYRLPVGTGCAGALGTPVLSATNATTGSVWMLTAANTPDYVIFALGFHADAWNGIPLPVDLGPLGMVGCQAFVQPEHVASTSSTGGVASIRMMIPDDPTLYGVDVYAQAIVASFGTNQLGAVVTNGLRTRLGAW